MPIYALDGVAPKLPASGNYWIAPDAVLIGDIVVEEGATIWFGAVLRGDNERITIGPNSNVQEHCILHTDPGFPLTIGDTCTIGHGVILHGCTIGDGALIGMGATLLNGAKIGKNCLVGAGALVTEGKSFEDNHLIVGTPAKAIRTFTPEQLEGVHRAAKHYVLNGERYRKGLKQVG